MNLRIWKPTLDCEDMEVATQFWTWLLGVTVTFEGGNTRFLGPEGGDPLVEPVMCLQQVHEPRSGKNRMHLDLLADDLDAAVEAVCGHGGMRVSEVNEVPGGRWFVMADPEGNEFCLVAFSSGPSSTGSGELPDRGLTERPLQADQFLHPVQPTREQGEAETTPPIAGRL